MPKKKPKTIDNLTKVQLCGLIKEVLRVCLAADTWTERYITKVSKDKVKRFAEKYNFKPKELREVPAMILDAMDGVNEAIYHMECCQTPFHLPFSDE